MYISSKADIRKAIVAKIFGLQFTIGGNLFPRVEIAEAYENEIQDKGDDLREVSIYLEIIGNASYEEVATIADTISSAICGCDTLQMERWRAAEITLVQSSDITEVGEADLLIQRIRNNYRILTTLK